MEDSNARKLSKVHSMDLKFNFSGLSTSKSNSRYVVKDDETIDLTDYNRASFMNIDDGSER